MINSPRHGIRGGANLGSQSIHTIKLNFTMAIGNFFEPSCHPNLTDLRAERITPYSVVPAENGRSPRPVFLSRANHYNWPELGSTIGRTAIALPIRQTESTAASCRRWPRSDTAGFEPATPGVEICHLRDNSIRQIKELWCCQSGSFPGLDVERIIGETLRFHVGMRAADPRPDMAFQRRHRCRNECQPTARLMPRTAR
jgi:hypothetical protein